MKPGYILCPSDFSEESFNALSYALEMAERYRLKLRLLHVISRPYGDDITTEIHHEDNFGIVAANSAEQEQHLQAYAHVKIRELLEKVHPSQEIDIHIDKGNTASQILLESSFEDVSMIVMGSHHHAPLTHWLHPNVTAQVLNKARCPVLVVK
ncbi:universal stress protein [Shewanella sp. AS1]|uniref:universal stress protein n=1 Tax=Shewanella sp. AS1 TaxID=2907626 RepID=UPI001F1B13C9|nr:universal stress protein [Shewanella sp. AS1]MCE9678448.1 universal stress protein [Shewanella sp. AS1]